MKTDVLLHEEIYAASAIQQAVADYTQLAKITIKRGISHYALSFHHCKYDKEQTICEFCNYVLDLMNCKE